MSNNESYLSATIEDIIENSEKFAGNNVNFTLRVSKVGGGGRCMNGNVYQHIQTQEGIGLSIEYDPKEIEISLSSGDVRAVHGRFIEKRACYSLVLVYAVKEFDGKELSICNSAGELSFSTGSELSFPK